MFHLGIQQKRWKITFVFFICPMKMAGKGQTTYNSKYKIIDFISSVLLSFALAFSATSNDKYMYTYVT